MVGQTISHYKITEKLGEGGMGVVYRAEDLKLGRAVALKFLPLQLLRSEEHKLRFLREARAAAALDHPNVCGIYEIDESAEQPFLAMPYIEGRTLQEKIAERPLPFEEALDIATQIAQGLQAAHEKGVVHRDIKPANIMITPRGQVKIMDFGLAQLSDRTKLTSSGVTLGTPAYMSPEQAQGQPADRRTDVWSLGVVLYEMISGQLPFQGDYEAAVTYSIVHEEPEPLTALRAGVPLEMDRLVSKALAKDVTDRYQHIDDLLVDVRAVRREPGEVSAATRKRDSAPGAVTSEAAPRRNRPASRWLVPGLAGILIGAAAAALLVWNLKPAPTLPRPVTRFTIELPPGQRLEPGDSLALSADGSQLAYVAATQDGGDGQIYLRAMDRSEARMIPGAEGAVDPFFSPDGDSLGFFADGKLKTISLKGGVAKTLTNLSGSPRGAVWTGQHTIVFASLMSTLLQVSDSGGNPLPLTRFKEGETAHLLPELMPDGKAIIFLTETGKQTAISMRQIGAGVRRNLIRAELDASPGYISSGYLIYAQAGNLMAAPVGEHFDVKNAVSAVQGVLQYCVSRTGSLVYVSGKPQTFKKELVWVSRAGKEQILGAPARNYNQPRLSPDGGEVAVDIVDPRNQQVWLYDFARNTLSPFTFEGTNRHAVWAPDGKRIAFMSDRADTNQIYWKLADGSGGLERLTDHSASAPRDTLKIPYSFSPDGKLLAFAKITPATGTELSVLQVDGTSEGSGKNREGRSILHSETADGAPQLSPDGHWLAFASEESGHREIYVQAYPGPGDKHQVSTDGGNEPQWNRNGRELFYRNGDKMMSVGISTQPGFEAGNPRILFRGNYRRASTTYVRANYDVSPDGQRFLMLKPVEQEEAPLTGINVVINWSEELKRLIPRGK